MSKLTPWFPHETKPVRDGVYKTSFSRYPGGARRRGFSHWGGSTSGWGCQRATASRALDRGTFGEQKKTWRGLAQQPKVKAK